jgi:hypothetical protein
MAGKLVILIYEKAKKHSLDCDVKEVKLNEFAALCEKQLKISLSEYSDTVRCTSFLHDAVLLDLSDSKTLAEAGVTPGATIVLAPKVMRLRPRAGKAVAAASGVKADVSVDADTAIPSLERAKGATREGILAWIDKNGKAVMESKSLLQASEASWIAILQRDTCSCREDILFDGLVRWGKAKAKSPDDLKKVLAKILPHIRFPTMNSKDFASKVVPLNILESAQTLDLFTYIAQRDSGKTDVKLGPSIAKMSTKKRVAAFAEILGSWRSTATDPSASSYYQGKTWDISGTEDAITVFIDYTPWGSRYEGSRYRLSGSVVQEQSKEGVFIRINDGQCDWEVSFESGGKHAKVKTWNTGRGQEYNFVIDKVGS